MLLEPLRNPIGFGLVDFVELGLAAVLVGAVVVWPRWVAPFFGRLSQRTLRCMIWLAAVPVLLRLGLLANHPIPSPDLYDEFGHLLVADTLRHFRLANPPHAFARFFETFFVLQSPTYSSIYPIGNGLVMALGSIVFDTPWAGVLLGCAALCALTFWMLKAWVGPGWALVGGVLAICLFGPLNQWTNNYWGGTLSAVAGCLVFGSLPRLRDHFRLRDGVTLGLGLGIHLLTRPYESVFMVIAVVAYFVPRLWRPGLLVAAGISSLALGVTLLQNKRVTGEWTTLPYALSQAQYGVPAALTFQPDPVPHRTLTPQQESDYRMQSGFQAGPETFGSFANRLIYRVRYYRFYLFAPMYLAVFGFVLHALRRRDFRWLWVLGTCVLFALGVNFFPAFQFHYLAGIVCLFLLITVKGLEAISRLKHGQLAARVLVALAFAQFSWAYVAHIADQGGYDLWTSINHTNPERRIQVNREIEKMPGKLLIFVRYWPAHPFQDEWVYNGADIDGQRVVWARDLGAAENQQLIAYYGNRTALLLEPDARPPSLEPWAPEPVAPPATPQPTVPAKKPLLELEQVR
ncbi:MAG: hypothetical protein JWN34_694 [Bryobacterales bacterium]|nr:hypothetical protein [Bryobacterales bacterium]